ncbi:MAG: DUF58 domain-containing protein [Chloroflexota bacterium]|nr:DUF58 domain-containing protein [Chloroflexota bacterium]
MKIVRFILAIALIALLAQGAHLRLLFVLDYALIGVLVFSFVWTRLSLYGITVERRGSSERSQVGHYFDEFITLRNHFILPKLWLEVTDNSELPGHKLTCVQSLRPLGRAEWKARTYCSMRGRYRLGPIIITAGDPFGLFRLQRCLPAHCYLTIYPTSLEIRHFEGLNGTMPGGNTISSPTHHITPNINGLRDYRPGDSLNRIHWASSARQRRLIVKEFEFDPEADIQLFLDLNVEGHWVVDPDQRKESTVALPASQATFRSSDSTEEYTIAAAATLTRHFLERGRSVGLVAWGQHHEQIAADRGERQLIKLFEALAILRTQGSTDFGQLITAELPRLKSSDTLVLVTASLEESWISVLPMLLRKNIKVAVALIEPGTFGAKQGSLLTVGGLASMNIPTYLIKRGDNIGQALSTELTKLAVYVR